MEDGACLRICSNLLASVLTNIAGANKVTNDMESGGIFYFDDATNNKINEVNFRGSSCLPTKQLNMLGYLWEFAYDLCIAPGSNISGNPGLEVLLGTN